VHEEFPADGEQAVGFYGLCRGFLHGEPYPEINKEDPKEESVNHMEGSHSVVFATQPSWHDYAHEDENGGIIEEHEPSQELHEAVLLEHGMSFVAQIVLFAQEFIELPFVHVATFFGLGR
jgi:hypothetical protein